MLASKAGARAAVTAPAGGFGAAFSNCLVLLANSPVKAFVRRRRNMTFAPLSGVSAVDFTGNTAGPAAETRPIEKSADNHRKPMLEGFTTAL